MTRLEQSSAGDGPTRLDTLTGVRWIAAFAVFGYHLTLPPITHAHLRGFLNGAFGSGYTGVSLFFILSGFVLTWSQRSKDTKRRFYQRRFARIWPSHAVAWAAMGVLGVAYGYISVRPGPALASLALVQSWIPNVHYVLAMNGVSWTLSCEAFFYLLFPLLLRRARTWTLVTRRSVMGGLTAGLIVLPLVVHAIAGSSFAAGWLVNYFPPVRLAEFVIGILLALEVRDRTWPRVRVRTAAVLSAATFFAAWHLPDLTSLVAATFIPYALLIGALAQSELAGQPSVLKHRVIVWLGERSYAFYLIQGPVAYWLFGQFNFIRLSVTAIVAVYFTALLLTIIAAELLHVLVERPAERWLRPGRPRLTAGV